MESDAMVIIGAGQAGARAAHALREAGWDGRIVLVGDEPHLPYERPPLSKALLAGTATREDCRIYDDDFFAGSRIDVHLGVSALAIDRPARLVRLSDGSALSYNRLLLTTGASPRRLRVPGADLSGVVTLRSLEEATTLATALRPGIRLAVIGGGLIGLEVAAAAIGRGVSVHVIESTPRLLMRAVPERIAEIVLARHRAAGVVFTFGQSVSHFSGDGSVTAAVLGDGTTIPCDVALVSIGAVPRTELAANAGLLVDAGIVVDASLRTADPRIFAAGDVCSFEHAHRGRHIRLEHWQNAEDQSRHAARGMLGASDDYLPIPWFWSDQYEIEIQAAGFIADSEKDVVRHVGEGRLTLFHLASDDRLVGVSGVGARGTIVKDVRIGRMMMERGIHPPPAMLGDPKANLKALVR